MKTIIVTIVTLVQVVFGLPAQAQMPHIEGTWQLNLEASELAGPRPQSQLRRYIAGEDGFLIGLAVTIDAEGMPDFLQIAAKSDGKDYPEYSSGDLAALQMQGTPTPLAYSEISVDAHTVEWFDKYNGEVYASGTRQVSEDGQTMTILAEIRNQQSQVTTLMLVFDRQ